MSGMEVKHKELLELHRAKFSVSVDVDRLCPILQGAGIITQNDVAEILSQVSKSAQVETLLDILPSKGSSAFQSLCSALESTYPHLLTVMFLGSNQKVTDSMSTSLTWDSEDEALRHSPQPGERQVGVASPTTYTRIIPSYAYDIQPQEVPSSTEHPVKSDPKLPSHPGDITKTRTNQKSVGMHEERQRDYDWLKSQCEKAMNELQALKRQHGDTVKRCDQAMKEADFYHRNYKSSVNKLDQATEEIDSVKARCNDVILEKNKLSQELAELRKLHEEDKTEIADLLKQQRDVISEGASSEVLKLYDSAQDKYEALRKDYDNLQKRFADQLGEYSTSANKLEFTMEENARLKKQYEDAISERNCALMERNGLKQQCTAAIRNWDIAIQERNKIKDEFEAVKIQEDSLSKELHQIVHSQLKAKQDFDRICDERNAALNEYKLVMSERDSVHKEIEQLQDRLHEAVKEVETLRADKKALQDEGESLRREISCALQDRDKALKEVNDLRERFGDVCSEKNEVQKERDEFRKDYYMVAQERDVARHERQEALVHRDQILRETYEKTAREKAEEMEQVAKETEALKKHIEKLTQDYLDSVQEADIAKKRRDWAFGERDKIVQERESIRTLCDKLRRERDRAVSDLAQALRDSDDLKKQKNEMYKELKEIRERCETTIEPDVRKSQLNSVSHNHSRDSAIDADLHEWETETLELDLGNMNSADLGFDLVGGKDDPQFPNDNSLFVSHISKGSAVYGKLRLNDLLVKVNNVDVTNVEKQAAFQAVINNSGVVNMVVRRKKSSNRSNQPVQISITLGKGHDDPGIQLENGLFISRISPNSSIAKDRALNLGDRILAVNGQTVEKMSIPAVLKVLGESYDSVVLDIWKPTSPMSSAGPSPTPPSQSSPRDLPTTPPMRKPLVQNHMWESTANCASSESKSTSNLKALKCSGSQTDSLDSPSPRKKHHEHKHDKDEKNRHSSHPDWLMIIKRFLPKNHEERERERLNKSNSGMSAAEENVIAEFENVLENYDLVKAKPSKPPEPIKGSDINNGGTWPKTHHSKLDFEGPGTVIQCPHGRRERSRLPPEFIHPRARNKIPPEPPERTNSSVDATFRHSPQNSDLSVKHSAPSLAAPAGSRQLPLISSQIKLPVSSSHSIGGHTPNSRGSHYPAYSTPVHSSEGGQRDLLSLYLDKKKMGRPTSAPGRGGDRRYHMAIPNLYPVPDNKPPSLDVHRLYPSPGPSYSPIRPAVSPTDFLPRGPDRPLPFGPHFHGKATSPINFPSSISPTFAKGPPSMISSYPGESSPISGQLMTSPSNVSQSMSASYCSSPPGGIPNMHYFRELSNPRIPELDRYHGPSDKRATISPSPSQQSNIALDRSTPTPSDDPYSQLYARPSPHSRPLPTYYDGRSTIPRRAQDRICIPSNASVLAKSSTGSVDYVPERGSPMSPMFPMDMSERASSTSLSSSLPMTLKPRKPLPGEQRTIIIEKTADVVGFQIKTGPNGGIFVSTVNENSLASQNGLEVGDQLIEVCGINMRNATKDLAASVLRQCRDTFAMVLQYNPDKFNGDSSESSNPSSPLMSHPSSPDPLQSSHRVSSETLTTQTAGGSNPVRHNANASVTEGVMEPRFVFLERSTPSMELGIEVIGGNAAGIFVHEVDPDSAAARPGGLQKGDHILEFNGVDLRSATLEQACSELSKGNSKVTILAQYNMAKYNNICPGMGDFFFIRTHFDRTAENEGELSFKKDDILLIETTRFKKVGVWFGWLVDDEGKKIKGGSIPSKFRLEDELVLRRSLSENLSLIEDDFRPGSRRGSNSVRRSIFRKRRHQRNNSKDSREFGSFSDASLNSDSVPVLDDGSLYTYTRVERVEYSMTRPVIILAPFAEPIILKLTSESPDKYCCCPTMEMSVQSIENALSSCQIIDYWKRDDHYECVSAAAVQNVCDKKCHCLLNTTPSAIERLRQLKIYPIVLFCRHKSAKQIREVRDVQFLSERISTKSSRDLFDQYHKLEQENRHLFTGIIQGGNLAEMCTQIKRVIATEQQKTIWVAAGSL